MEGIESIILKENEIDSLDQDQQNLLYFYHLIKQFFTHHVTKTELSKEELINYVKNNEIVDYLEKTLEEEHEKEKKE